MSERVETLAYEQACRLLDQQRDTLSSLQTRAGTVLAAAALATSFFGREMLRHARAEFATGAAVVFFIALLICVVRVLWPAIWIVGVSPGANLRAACVTLGLEIAAWFLPF
jgi:hypothetical protein